jgi:hypothetical protein
MGIPEYITREVQAMNAAAQAAQEAADASWAQSGLAGRIVVSIAKRRPTIRDQFGDRQFGMENLWSNEQ